jgi:lectin, mannose-binding 1
MHIKSYGLSALLLAALSFAQDLVEQASFGYGRSISSNSFSIPRWQLSGERHQPQLLSDKVILTPPYGSHKRGALWSESKNTLQDWAVELEFRAGGPDRGGGSIQLWYVADGLSSIGTSSIYTAGKFDGLALVLDTHNGKQSIRGFLNDGSTDYRTQASIDGLAFGHCDYAYRNLGRPSQLRVRSTSAGLEVMVDDKACFLSNNVVLPKDYTFGITAASSDPPDSFEVFKFLLKTTPSSAPPPPPQQNPIDTPDPSPPLTQYSSSDLQDLASRLTLLSKSITNLFGELTRLSSAAASNHAALLHTLSSSSSPASVQLSTLASRLDKIEAQLSAIQQSLPADHAPHLHSLSQKLDAVHRGMHEHLPNRIREYVAEHSPRVGFMIAVFVCVQVLSIGGYVAYKWRRRGWGGKKYL